MARPGISTMNAEKKTPPWPKILLQTRIYPTPWSGQRPPPRENHGPNPPLSAVNPMNKRVFCLWPALLLDLVSQTMRPRGRGRPLFAEFWTPRIYPQSTKKISTKKKKPNTKIACQDSRSCRPHRSRPNSKDRGER